MPRLNVQRESRVTRVSVTFFGDGSAEEIMKRVQADGAVYADNNLIERLTLTETHRIVLSPREPRDE